MRATKPLGRKPPFSYYHQTAKKNLVHYYGALAPRSPLRPLLAAKAEKEADRAKCSLEMKPVAVILNDKELVRLLTHLGLPAGFPEYKPAPKTAVYAHGPPDEDCQLDPRADLYDAIDRNRLKLPFLLGEYALFVCYNSLKINLVKLEEKATAFLHILLRKTELSKDVRSEYREQCYICRRVKKNCLCDSIKPFSTRMRFVILMHSKEAREQKTGTARLAKLCLTNAELLTGVDFTHSERVNSLLRDPSYSPFVLYPGPKAVNLKTPGDELTVEGKTLLIFVIDGTWACAKRVLNKSRNILDLPRLSFSRGYISQFAIKRQPRAHCVSTIEAIYYLCKEAEEAGYEDLNTRHEILMVLLKKLVATQMQYKSGRGRKREDNKRKNTGNPET